MGKPRAPKAPDYAAAAEAQGEANLNSALASNAINQINQVGPNGSLTYSYGNSYTLPDGTVVPVGTATTTLSPEQQALYDQNNQISQSMNNIALQGLDYAGSTAMQPIDLAGLPQRGGVPTPGQFQTTFGEGTPLATSYDLSRVSDMPNLADFNSTRDQVTDAYMQRLQPYMDRERDAMNTRLANQGITQGSEAYGWDQNILNRGQNDQRIAALLAGDKAAQDLFNNAMGVRQQGVSEAIAQGNFGNQAQAQNYSQLMQRAQFANQGAESAFNQGLASSQFANQARAQALQEQDYVRNQPINIINALRSGNQVQMPQFGNVAGGAQIAAAPVYQAAADQYGAQMNAYNSQMQNYGSMMGGLASIGGAAIMASDRRLKKVIAKLGELADGLAVYLFEYLWGVKMVGVMADEVAIKRPWALGPTIAGYATVNYGKLNHGC